ncbi:MAG: DUF5060 domain-containing protein [Muribaculaceae bacterium]|nr:DUF5060 domain-containing protein [Muribaculaceae bacterium]
MEKWRVFEIAMNARCEGNAFTDVEFVCDFTHGADTVRVAGFYDGDGVYRIRFMPDKEGRWNYRTSANIRALNNRKGFFECVPAGNSNHGPVKADSVRFHYADGSRYTPVGTTCYAWIHQCDSLKRKTVETLRHGYFNKIRMCIFPKSYDWNHNEPEHYPFEGAPGEWDFSKFNPEYFRNIEAGVLALDSLGIEADLIVFHPYDRWGFSRLDRPTQDRFMAYLISRFGAYKNVWWSMANEFDFMDACDDDDWKHNLAFFAEKDPYGHLRSIHNGARMYDQSDPNVTHVSIQNPDTRNGWNLVRQYHKPVVYDECRYEGNIPWSWGTLSGEEMLEKFWSGYLCGASVGHGEVLLERSDLYPWNSDEILWWAKGGSLKGKSPERIKFLRKILEESPEDMTPHKCIAGWDNYPCLSSGEDYFLLYFVRDTQCQKVIDLPSGRNYRIDVIDTWDMTVTPLPGVYSGQSLVALPPKPYMALRIAAVK